ncbi:MAG: prepilin-type N-terminal cleavage/methylation domain-containing protein [Nitrospirae bacterium]|nr:prepilin-type N-terminal cleavage/methylation domain-containing protein [Nitrospirota bacterium]MBF0540942.1 prepilin-type N-terminal cleavage/methylation domain-containing protein [Nitrospirota bacterium]
MTTHGFTLIELLIVIFILSLCLFTLIPIFDVKFLDTKPPVESELNKILNDASIRSKELSDVVEITFIIGSGNIHLNNKIYKLPDDILVSSASLNDEPIHGLAFSAKVYPEGLCDYIELNLSDNTIIVSLPLFNIMRLQ